jgi:inhibitor of cysteine peptidase
MNCKKVNQLLVSYLDNEVSPEEREAIQAHLSACNGCREELEALAETQRELRQGLNMVAAGASASSHAWSAVKERTETQGRNGIPILEALKSKVRDMIGRLRPRPVWQKALASVVTVAMVAGLCLGIPALSKQSPAGGQNGSGPQPSQASPVSSGLNGLPRFASYDELEKFVGANAPFFSYQKNQGIRLAPYGVVGSLGVENSEQLLAGSVDFSTTNIQVEGVDEADIVKTDGEFIYLVSGSDVFIVKAYPPDEARVLSKIKLGQEPEGIFINRNMLVVLEESWKTETLISTCQTSIKVYDVTDRKNPDLVRDVSVDGQYFGARMIGDYAYVMVSEPVRYYNDKISLPEISWGNKIREIPATDIYHFDVSDSYYGFTTIMAVNMQNAAEEPSHETILLGATSNFYVSANNIYIAVTDWGYSANGFQSTSIHRIHIDQGKIEYKASGEVPGRVLDQFSMDENQGFFRVATTSWGQTESEGVVTSQSQNNVYVLSMDLDIVGRLENLAPGESIYSARFVDERCYLVTFKQVDPFFVIDLKDPYNPQVLGALKITGYSDYLQPYDENHIIGIGKETVASGYQDVKISLFDVTDVSHPTEIAKYEIGDQGSDSPVLTDHKALLFDRSKNLLVIPVSVVDNGPGDVWQGWQGAYVFHISVDDGIQYRGRITHYDGDVGGDYYPFSLFPGRMVPAVPMYGPYSPYAVTRSLYIGDVLYTISQMKIKMNSLESLDLINEVAVS